jgi:DNA polymerase IV
MIRWLYLDLNSYFATVEQQVDKKIRNKPMVVVPMVSDSTCAIAASYEAKVLGISTGTRIYEAKRICPDLICVPAKHDLYVEYHEKIYNEVNNHVPISKVCSIDEFACRLIGIERSRHKALEIANNIKRGIRENVGEYITCSIGISSNKFLAKTASDFKKPDGLVILDSLEIKEHLLRLKLTDLTGIGYSMAKRLYKHGIYDVESLFSLDARKMRKVWGSIEGEKFYYLLHGHEVEEKATIKRTIGHSKVLEPSLRDLILAKEQGRILLLKAASRLRRINYCCRELYLSVRDAENRKYKNIIKFVSTQDSFSLIKKYNELWDSLYMPINVVPRKISVGFFNLSSNLDTRKQLDLFTDLESKEVIHTEKQEKLSKTIDIINRRYGKAAVTIGDSREKTKNYSGAKIAFNRIPDKEEFY